MSTASCPRCNAKNCLRNNLTLIVALNHWDIALMFSLIVYAFSRAYQFNLHESTFFVFLVTVPILLILRFSVRCLNCQSDFHWGRSTSRSDS